MFIIKKFALFEKDKDILKLCYINNHKVLIYTEKEKSKIYLYLPFEIQVEKKNNYLIFSIEKENHQYILTSFLKIFDRLLKKNKRHCYKKLTLTGLGFRINFLNKEKKLRFKLGYSHLIDIAVPDDLTILARKNTLHVIGHDPILIGNFCKKIKHLKYPNIYSGKGFWYKNEKRDLKIFKKK